MVTVKVNTISKASGNNVAMQVPLNLKSYTTTARDALTSAAGDIIYNETDNKVQFYNGSAWSDL
jgi:predicted nucleic acid-binding OB-fold protein